MVHALRETWRVLVPRGHLLDLRPRASNWPLEVVADGQVMLAGKVDNALFVPDDSAAESAIQCSVREGLYSLEQHVAFECASYWNTLDAMVTYQAESVNPSLTLPDDVLAKARELTATAHQPSKVRIRLSMDLVRYRKLGPQMRK
jgi:hypothetical protein